MSTQIVAEIGQAHDGSLGILYSLVDAAIDCGVDAVKFQMHIAESESSEHEQFRVAFSPNDNSRFDYWKRMEFTESQWAQIKAHVEARGVEFLCTPFSCEAVDRLERLGVKRYKVGSGEVSDHLLLSRIAKTGKPVILSSGMSDYSELDTALHILRQQGVSDLSLMQCTTRYPTPPEQAGLNVLDEFTQRYDLAIGYSDHSGDIYMPLAAVARGAKIVECHLTFDKAMFGPDAKSSLTPSQLKTLVEGIRQLDLARKYPVDKNDLSDLKAVKQVFGKSLAVNKALAEGHRIEFDDLETKKPGGIGLPVNDFQSVIGKRLTRAIEAQAFLTQEHIETTGAAKP